MNPASLVGGYRLWRGAPRPDATLGRMAVITLQEFQEPSLVEVAGDIVDETQASIGQRLDNGAMARALLEWLREHTRFVPDPIGQQLLKTPLYLLRMIRVDHHVAADCVDVAMLGAALAMAVGMRVKFIAESYSSPCNAISSPLVHVYTIVQSPDGWLAMDTQQPADGTPVTPCRRVELELS